jgi:hypothetical protein
MPDRMPDARVYSALHTPGKRRASSAERTETAAPSDRLRWNARACPQTARTPRWPLDKCNNLRPRPASMTYRNFPSMHPSSVIHTHPRSLYHTRPTTS